MATNKLPQEVHSVHGSKGINIGVAIPEKLKARIPFAEWASQPELFSKQRFVEETAQYLFDVYGIGTDGKKIDLDGEGNLVVMPGARIVIDGSGYEPGSEVEIWLFSDPTLLGPVRASAGGEVSGSFVVPPAVETGDHRVVLSGVEKGGSESIIGVGLRIGAYEKEDGLNKWLIILPLVLATMLALVIPTTARRRKRANG